MDVKEFVREALVQVLEGVHEAQSLVTEKKTGWVIHPSAAQNITADEAQGGNYLMRFDIAVTASDSEGKERRVGLRVVGLDFGGGKEARQETSSISRITFAVPIAYNEAKF
jgi:hypothetical protein